MCQSGRDEVKAYILHLRERAAEVVVGSAVLRSLIDGHLEPDQWKQQFLVPRREVEEQGQRRSHVWMDEALSAGFAHLLEMDVGSTTRRGGEWGGRWW